MDIGAITNTVDCGMVNTIECRTYNVKERERLYSEYTAIERKAEEWSSYVDSIIDTATDDEWESAMSKWDELRELSNQAHLRCFAAQFSKCRNKWFHDVIFGMPADGISRRISRRQYECFSRYTKKDRRRVRGRLNYSYCRVDNKFVELSTDGVSMSFIEIVEL